jgi:putative membrane protein
LGIKALHLTAVIIWMSAMFFAPPVLVAVASIKSPARQNVALRLKKWFSMVSGIGIAATWLLGIYLLTTGGWMNYNWMMVKLVLVLIFSGLHGFLAAQFKHVANDEDYRPDTWAIPVFTFQFLMILSIAYLVILKPF